MKPEIYTSLALCAVTFATVLMLFASFWTEQQARLQPKDSLGGCLLTMTCGLLCYVGKFFLVVGKDAKPIGFVAIWLLYARFPFFEALPLMLMTFCILCYGYFVAKRSLGQQLWNEAI